MKAIERPTEKQMKYIQDIQENKEGVPFFIGRTKQEAIEYISKYKDYPDKIVCIDDYFSLFWTFDCEV